MSEPGISGRRRVVIVAIECALIVALLTIWLASDAVRSSKSLVVLFLYSFPSEFLMGLVPHEPALIFYGMHHPDWLVLSNDRKVGRCAGPHPWRVAQ